jgi:hypothetical protein
MKPAVLLFGALAVVSAQEYTRGPGQYPGAPSEYAGPRSRIDSAAYRNLALRRPAYHSSAYDYNLTAQLVTDGIKETVMPRRLKVSTSDQGVLPIHQREQLFDDNYVTAIEVRGGRAWIQIEMAGGAAPPAIDRVDLDGAVRAAQQDWQNWTVALSCSDDGAAWRKLKRLDGMARPTGEMKASLRLGAPARVRFLRLEFLSGRELTWHFGEIGLFLADQPVRIAGPFLFTSAWMPAAGGDQWVYVDLGAKCTFDRVALAWIRRPAGGRIETSDDAANWTPLQDVPAAADIRLPQPASARYVRVSTNGPEPPVLSELEVYGRGGPVPEAKAAAAPASDGGLRLTGGAWRVERASKVNAAGATLSTPGFADGGWLPATVPGTVLVSYLNAGAIPDPNFGDNQLMISDSYFYSDFWYRNEFTAPAAPGRMRWLDFAGINWKAEVFLNGQRLGRIEGGFTRARFDVTAVVHPGQKNALAVRISKNATPGNFKEKTFDSPGVNGGALGADNPTFHASIGWDWIPTIHGRDTGIWNEVALTTSGAVTLEDPFVQTTAIAPDGSRADLQVEATLVNHSALPVSGVLRGKFGDIAFEAPVKLAASGRQTVRLDQASIPQLRVATPRLWWPAGYGEPNLYPVDLAFETGGAVADRRQFQSGIRQFTYSEAGNALKMWINGRRFIPRGGNWGFGESMLRYRAREYDAAVRYHREINFNMIRNWVGQIGEDAFYEACDRHGVVVWQDFWLANPWDGPDPDDDRMFSRNSRDMVLRIRNHPSIGLYCGRNEGYPPLAIEADLRKILADLHPGMHYIPSSADDTVSGHGPYQAMPVKYYFTDRATPKMHSELGMPSIVSMDSLRLMMPEAAMWPQGRMWGLHDFALNGAQGGRSFRAQIDQAWGGAKDAAEWVALAQMVNYDGYRAMFEAQSKNRMGLIIWMSHSCWPSMVWQTYDYFFNPGSAYFGSRKGSEPLHIQWNAATGRVEVVNLSGGDQKGLTARAEVLNLDGSVQWEHNETVDSKEDSTVAPFAVEFPSGVSAVHFIRLRLARGGDTVSDNFYWHGTQEGNYRALRDLPKVAVEVQTRAERRGETWQLSSELRNGSETPALMVVAKAVRETSGDRILPAIYSDNYVSLMPGERRTITTEVKDADTRGERPAIVLEGFNVMERSR